MDAEAVVGERLRLSTVDSGNGLTEWETVPLADGCWTPGGSSEPRVGSPELAGRQRNPGSGKRGGSCSHRPSTSESGQRSRRLKTDLFYFFQGGRPTGSRKVSRASRCSVETTPSVVLMSLSKRRTGMASRHARYPTKRAAMNEAPKTAATAHHPPSKVTNTTGTLTIPEATALGATTQMKKRRIGAA